MKWLDGITDAMDVNLGKLREMVRSREAGHAAVHGLQRVRHDCAIEQQQEETAKNTNMWRVSNILPNNQWIIEEIKEEI